VIGLPPLLAGAVHVAVADPFPAVATPMVGAPGAVLIPVPESATATGEPAFVVIVSVADFSPAVVGANRSVTTQDPPGSTVPHGLAVIWN
jgi:hypothetical protein